MNDINLNDFILGLFSLNTRRFGNVAEIMIKKKYNFDNSKSNAYDLLSKNGNKIEVKFSRVQKKCSTTITEKNVIQQTINSTIKKRSLTYNDTHTSKFDCNIQQIKPKEFDELYYGCFFEDKILICKITSEEILKDLEKKEIHFSYGQHRENKGNEGQFHINNDTLQIHLEKYFVTWFTYEELITLFEK